MGTDSGVRTEDKNDATRDFQSVGVAPDSEREIKPGHFGTADIVFVFVVGLSAQRCATGTVA